MSNPIVRAADQRVVSNHEGRAITIHDKGHNPQWRRGRGHRSHGEITLGVCHENGVPILTIITVEISGDEAREVKFELFGTAAIEALEIVRTVEAVTGDPWKGL